MSKNKIIVISLLLLVSAIFGTNSAYCEPIETNGIEIQNGNLDFDIDEAIKNSLKEVETPHVEDIRVMTPNANKEIKNKVLNDTDNNLRFTLKKFAFAMLGVIISAITLFLILVTMNKIHDFNLIRFQKRKDEGDFIKDEIIFQGNYDDALKTFFEKTR